MTLSRFSRLAQYAGLITIIAGTIVTVSLLSTEAWAASATNMPAAHAPGASDIKNSTAAVGASLQVKVSLSPVVADKAAPNDVVYIFARAAQGSRMPLAIVRKQVKDLPATVVLDDSQGMNPQMKLSSMPEVIVVARVSKSGMASPQDGDLEGVSAPVTRGAKSVAISIAKVLTGQNAPGSPSGYR